MGLMSIVMPVAFLLAIVSKAIVPLIMDWASWNAYRVNISREIICKEADAMAGNGLKYVGYDHINIDDGFFGGRSADGTLLIHSTRFPDGLKGRGTACGVALALPWSYVPRYAGRRS